MKYLLIILMTITVGCSEDPTGRRIVTNKYFHYYDTMPPCICKFYWDGGRSFQDSCDKYNVGDTIIGKRK